MRDEAMNFGRSGARSRPVVVSGAAHDEKEPRKTHPPEKVQIYVGARKTCRL